MVEVCPKEPWYEGFAEPSACFKDCRAVWEAKAAGLAVEEVDGQEGREEAAAGGRGTREEKR